jgi:glycosyltransferase involved in cell wall biosynthesis
VLVVGNFLSAAVGNRSVCEDLAERLLPLGWRVLTTSRHAGRWRRLADMTSTIWRRRHDYQLAQVDVYSGRAFFLAEAACACLRAAGKPFVLTLHGGNLPAFARRWPQRVRRLLGRASAVTTPSRYLLEQMQPYHNGLVLLPNALDLDAYPYRTRSRLRPRLIWLRAFSHIYNPALAAKTLALLAPQFPDVQLVMIGPDKGDGSLQDMQRLAEKLGVSNRIHVAGPVPKADVPHWLNDADVFLNTTNVDNTPVSVLEALACGLCVVTTNVGGVPYLVCHDRSALLVPPQDAEAMARCIRRLLSEEGLAQRLSDNARHEVERFDWAAVLPQWDRILLSASGNLVESCATDCQATEQTCSLTTESIQFDNGITPTAPAGGVQRLR